MKAKPRERLSLTWASQGWHGSGKSHFALTAPEPIAVMLFDPNGIGPLLRKPEFKGKDIRVIEYRFSPLKLSEAERLPEAERMWDQVMEDYATALKNARTVIWDRESCVWELLRYAKFDALSDRPNKYQPLNATYADLIADAEEACVNFGVLRGMKAVWGDSAGAGGTGKFEAEGQGKVNNNVGLVLHHWFDEESKTFKARIGGDEGVEHPKCRYGDSAHLIGEVLDNLDFTTLATLLYPDEDETAWT